MDATKFTRGDYADSSIADAVEALLNVNYDTLNKTRAVSSCLVVLANAFPAEAKNISKVLAFTQAAKPKNVVSVRFESSNKTEPGSVPVPCANCPDPSKEPAIKTIEDVLAMGDKAYLLSVARNMGIKTHPSMKPETIAAKILKGVPDEDVEEPEADDTDNE